jgi:hypothetical protein
MELALEAGAEDLVHDDEQFEILTDPSVFNDVCDALETAGIAVASKEITLAAEFDRPGGGCVAGALDAEIRGGAWRIMTMCRMSIPTWR